MGKHSNNTIKTHVHTEVYMKWRMIRKLEERAWKFLDVKWYWLLHLFAPVHTQCTEVHLHTPTRPHVHPWPSTEPPWNSVYMYTERRLNDKYSAHKRQSRQCHKCQKLNFQDHICQTQGEETLSAKSFSDSPHYENLCLIFLTAHRYRLCSPWCVTHKALSDLQVTLKVHILNLHLELHYIHIRKSA